MGSDLISKKYGIPSKEISCPDCGKEYGHHKTTVELHSQLCSSCFLQRKKLGDMIIEDPKFVNANYFIHEILKY